MFLIFNVSFIGFWQLCRHSYDRWWTIHFRSVWYCGSRRLRQVKTTFLSTNRCVSCLLFSSFSIILRKCQRKGMFWMWLTNLNGPIIKNKCAKSISLNFSVLIWKRWLCIFCLSRLLTTLPISQLISWTDLSLITKMFSKLWDHFRKLRLDTIFSYRLSQFLTLSQWEENILIVLNKIAFGFSSTYLPILKTP